MDSAEAGNTDRLGDCRKRILRMVGAKQISLGITDENGHRPVVVVDEHALISDVLVQAARTDGCANLFVLADDGSVEVADLLPSESSALPAIVMTFNEPIERNVEVGKVLELAGHHPDGINFPIKLPRQSGTIRNPQKLEDLVFEEV